MASPSLAASASPSPSPSPGSARMRPSMAFLARPSMTLRDHSNVFAEEKLSDARVEVFSSDVLMEGELSKKGEGGLQTWKSRMFVLRGQELAYYTVDRNQRTGALKGSLDVRDATVERVEDQSFSLSLASGGDPRVLAAPSVQALMDWMTAISIAAQAHVIAPPSELSLVDHSRTTHVILVRHGHYASSQTATTDLQGPLTDLGIEQARRTGAFLSTYLSARGVLKRFPVLPVYHSGVRRAVETAQRMSEGFPNGQQSVQLRENKLFREAWPGNPLPSTNRQMLPRENLESMVADCARLKFAYRTMFRQLIPGDLVLPETPLSDADKEAFARSIGARTTQTRVDDRFRIVVCHANIIRWFVCKALGVDPDGTWGRMRYNHCGISAFEIDSVGNVQLAYVNQTGHLDTTMLTENS
ncbi:hypothetical protein PybrP1_000029 [[Pythium] brassicae (nom. inval.)]|nr:hypothetical protein PybrP1_000029 [[Pythium] brassicae (nom. inval.)]